MQKKRLAVLAGVLTAALLFSGCGILDAVLALVPQAQNPYAPNRMVQYIDVEMVPRNPDFDRHYQGQKNMTALLNLLRSIQTQEIPENEPDLLGGETYYAITATYASGKQQNYYLLGHRALKMGDEPWCVVDGDSAMKFNQFLREHPSDNIPLPTQPTETQQYHNVDVAG